MNKEQLKKKFKLVQIIWTAMIVSLAIYAVIGSIAGDLIKKNAEIPLDMFKNVFYIISIVELGAAYYIRKLIIKPGLKITQDTAVQKYFIVSLITFALSESIGLYGLVLYFLGSEIFDMYIFMIISVAALFFFQPSFDDMEDYVMSSGRLS